MIRVVLLCVLVLTFACAPVQMVNHQADIVDAPQQSAIQKECAPCIAGAFFIFMGFLLVWAVTRKV